MSRRKPPRQLQEYFEKKHNKKKGGNYCIKGYTHFDESCQNCPQSWECQRVSLKRLMAISQDLNQNLFYDDEYEIKPLDTDHWRSVGLEEVWEVEDEELVEIKDQVIQHILEWESCHRNDPAHIVESLKNLRPSTRKVLAVFLPDFSENYMEEIYDKVHIPDLKEFKKGEKEKWGYHLRMPNWIIDNYLHRLTPSQWKVFTYIARRCTFDPSNQHFGRCWLKYEEIRRRTGVKDIQTCVRGLCEAGLIRVSHTRRSYGGSSIVTINLFTVKYFRQMKRKGLWKSA